MPQDDANKKKETDEDLSDIEQYLEESTDRELPSGEVHQGPHGHVRSDTPRLAAG